MEEISDLISEMALEAPDRLPSKLDIMHIVTLLREKMTDSMDHTWQLREDPAYFHMHLEETCEHRLTMVKDVNGRDHPANLPMMRTQNAVGKGPICV
jgi:hypothetical protein